MAPSTVGSNGKDVERPSPAVTGGTGAFCDGGTRAARAPVERAARDGLGGDRYPLIRRAAISSSSSGA